MNMKQVLALISLLFVACVTDPDAAGNSESHAANTRSWSYDVGIARPDYGWDHGMWTTKDSGHAVTIQVRIPLLDSVQRVEFNRLRTDVYKADTRFTLSGPDPLVITANGSAISLPVYLVSESCDNVLDCTIQKEIAQ